MEDMPKEIWLTQDPYAWGAYGVTVQASSGTKYTRDDIADKNCIELLIRISHLEKILEEEGINF